MRSMFAILLIFTLLSAEYVDKGDSLALIALTETNKEFNYTNSWLTSDIKNWDGVILEKNGEVLRVTSLNLQKSNLNNIPPACSTLTALKSLNLSKNSNLNSIPPAIATLPLLTSLDISSTTIKELPKGFKNLQKLSARRLFLTSFELFGFENLEVLDFSENQLRDIPKTVRNLPKLKILIMESNSVTSLNIKNNDLPELEKIDLSMTGLTTVPSSLSLCPVLKEIDINNSKITQIESSITSFSTLTRLSLRTNKITKLPPFIIDMKELQVIDVRHNMIKKIPSELEQWFFEKENEELLAGNDVYHKILKTKKKRKK